MEGLTPQGLPPPLPHGPFSRTGVKESLKKPKALSQKTLIPLLQQGF